MSELFHDKPHLQRLLQKRVIANRDKNNRREAAIKTGAEFELKEGSPMMRMVNEFKGTGGILRLKIGSDEGHLKQNLSLALEFANFGNLTI